MKAIQFEITLLKKRKRIKRTLLVSKKATFDELHGMIQLLFNLDHVEEYEFKKGMHSYSRKKDFDKTLMKIVIGDTFNYYYDLVNELQFRLEAKDIVESDTFAKCIDYSGKNLYESVDDSIDESLQSKFDLEWVNASLQAYDSNYENEFNKRMTSILTDLASIRYFQDYLHNQIVEIDLPCRRRVYIGADASDDVVINFHINSNKLAEYSSIGQAAPQCIIKYHDCIECSFIKKSKDDGVEDFDYNILTYGVFFDYANVFYDGMLPDFFKEMYLYALDQYVKVIEYCSHHDLKFQYGKMLKIDDHDQISVIDGRLILTNVFFLSEELCHNLSAQYQKTDHICEVDVLSLINQNGEIETKCIVGDHHKFYEEQIYNGSLKTMLSHLFHLLMQRWDEQGLDHKIVMRDANLYKEMKKICDSMQIECELQISLEEIDEAYLSSTAPNLFEDMDPKEVILRLLEELGISGEDLKKAEIDDKLSLLFENDDKKFS